MLWSVVKGALGDENERKLGVPLENVHREKPVWKTGGTFVPTVIIRVRKPEEVSAQIAELCLLVTVL